MIGRSQAQSHNKSRSFENSLPGDSSLSTLKNEMSDPSKNQMSANLIKYEREIVAQYSHYKNVDQVFIFLSKKYKDLQWKKEDLVHTISKLVKIGLRKILKFRKEFIPQSPNLPVLNLNENIVKGIISAPVALQTRVIVVKSLLQNNLTLLRTVQLINAVNNCIQQLNSAANRI